MKKDDFVKLLSPDGNYRYGYISQVLDKGYTLAISLYNEGESKIAFDAEEGALIGYTAIDYAVLLSEVEKRIVPLLANGNDTRQIAEALSISPVTVRAHLRTLRLKLHLDDRNQLIAFSEGLNTILEEKARNTVHALSEAEHNAK